MSSLLPKLLLQEIQLKWQQRLSKGYKPRTKHLNSDSTPMFTNRLFLENSPYLLQHAHNPVNWYPWSDEAFELAKEKDLPVFLSVGYSTCHWCHVMEEESFEDLEIARFLNNNFISIKVDREERPDVDSLYMTVVQSITGRGGWPMSVWLNASREPFYGGTYFPPRDGDRGTHHGFLSLLGQLKNAYVNEREKLNTSSKQIVESVRNALELKQKNMNKDNVDISKSIEVAMFHYKENYDAAFGGVGSAPKFPSSLPIRLLLREAEHDSMSKDMLNKTLEKMALGGIYDHVDGGFHRYSTDAKWLVPHFEKMLYDNALLALHYTEAYLLEQKPLYKEVACDILDYLCSQMQNSDGGFFAATDADSVDDKGSNNEGYYFTWSDEEITNLFTQEEQDELSQCFKLTKEGNFEGRNVLERKSSNVSLSKQLREKMRSLRAKRTSPICDTKILLSWNAMCMSALAKASQVFDREDYLLTAEKTANFILTQMKSEGEELLHVCCDGEAKQSAFLEDYAFMIAALLDLFEASGNEEFFYKAKALDCFLCENFEDKEQGGFFKAHHNTKDLFAKEKPYYDGAEPSGNSVMASNLARLYLFTIEDAYQKRFLALEQAFAAALTDSPFINPEFLLSYTYGSCDAFQYVLIKGDNGRAKEFKKSFYESMLSKPGVLITIENNSKMHKEFGFLKDKLAIENKDTLYECSEGVCSKPIV